MSSNPYLPPASQEANVVFGRSVQIGSFGVNMQAFRCKGLTPERAVEVLQQSIANACRDRQLPVTQGEAADIVITGAIFEVDGGSQLLRYLMGVFAGSTVVHVEGEIHIKGQPSIPFRHVVRNRIGAFGGRSSKLIEDGLKRVGVYVVTDALGMSDPGSQTASQSVGGYYLAVCLISALIAVVLAVVGSQWAKSLPPRPNAIRSGQILPWAFVVGASSFATLLILATAFAPKRLLQSRGLAWLVASSGTKTIAGLRIVLFILAAVAGAACTFCFLVADG